MSVVTRGELDLRTCAGASHLDLLLARFDELVEGGSLSVLSQEDLRPLYERLREARPGISGWYPLDAGGVQRAEVRRLCPKDSEISINEYYGRDHDEIDVLLVYLRRDLEKAAAAGAGAPPSVAPLFEEFDRRLSRHIRWEEGILFPGVEEKQPELAEGPGRVMRWEHCKIHQFKGQLAELIRAGASTPAQAKEAVQLIDHLLNVLVPHNHKEESIYYPMSEHVFTREEQDKVLAATRAMA